MPVLERDPWRLQYFDTVPCPDDVVIPTDDPDSWLLFPQHRWVYDKLKVAESQGMACGPHGVTPPAYPVFSKPIVNLKGMGLGSRVITSADEMDHASTPGHMWMPLLAGPHVSTDCAILDGKLVWIRHATGIPWIGGTFKHWTVHAESLPQLEIYLRGWVEAHMGNYSGMMNFETIGGLIIEVHLRFADQWCDLYGERWVEALVRLYAEHRWSFNDRDRRNGYSVPLFARHGDGFRHPPQALQTQVRKLPHVKSLQITFHEHKPSDDHPMPPGGFRLAVINATNLPAAHDARRLLASAFPSDAVLDQD
jgi:hypothetical protein